MSLAKNVLAMLLVTGSLWGCSLSQEKDGARRTGLAGTFWEVEAIDGQPVVNASEVNIGFLEDGRVFGGSSCNRFTGGWSMQGDTLEFTQMASTRMACDDALMQQEHRFLSLLAEVDHYQFDDNGRLIMHTRDGMLIRAVLSEEGPE